MPRTSGRGPRGRGPGCPFNYLYVLFLYSSLIIEITPPPKTMLFSSYNSIGYPNILGAWVGYNPVPAVPLLGQIDAISGERLAPTAFCFPSSLYAGTFLLSTWRHNPFRAGPLRPPRQMPGPAPCSAWVAADVITGDRRNRWMLSPIAVSSRVPFLLFKPLWGDPLRQACADDTSPPPPS